MKTSSNMKNTFIKSISKTSSIQSSNATEKASNQTTNSKSVNQSRAFQNKNQCSHSSQNVNLENAQNNVCPREETEYTNAVSILLPTRKAASGATVNKTEYVVADGINPYVYIYSFCGMFKGAVPTLRPYSKIVYSMETDSYYALDGYCSSNIYTLNCRFEEIGKTTSECSSKLTGISLFNGSDNRCINSHCPLNAIEDCPNAERLLLTSPRSVFLSSKTGNLASTIRSSCRNVFINSFVAVENGFAESYCENSLEYIRISIRCKETTFSIPRCVYVKNLFTTDGGGIYGFFGKNYTNGYILPIYENECINMELTNFLLGKV